MLVAVSKGSNSHSHHTDTQAAVECNKLALQTKLSGDTATALKLFLKAYDLNKKVGYALSAADMHLTHGDHTSAIALYKELLRSPSKLTLRQHCVAERRITKAWRANAKESDSPLPLCMRHSTQR